MKPSAETGGQSRVGSVTEARQTGELVQQPQSHILESMTCLSVLGVCFACVCWFWCMF